MTTNKQAAGCESKKTKKHTTSEKREKYAPLRRAKKTKKTCEQGRKETSEQGPPENNKKKHGHEKAKQAEQPALLVMVHNDLHRA